MLWQKQPGLITRENVWRTAITVTIFLRRALVERVGFFDETLSLGSGTPWGSGDETDYVLRALASGFTLGYDPSIVVYHESPNPPFSRSAAKRAYGYGMGNSRVLRMHGYSRRFAAYRVLQLVAGSGYFLVRGRFGLARFYWAMARGRAVGLVQGEVTSARVAVLVACFNDGATIQETIDSLRAEAGIEFVVVDDGSSDPETLSALERLERDGVRVLRQENAGPSAAWMTGVAATSAPYVMPFSSDDVLLPGGTAVLADALDANPDASLRLGRHEDVRPRDGIPAERARAVSLARHVHALHARVLAVPARCAHRKRRLADDCRIRGLGSVDAHGGARTNGSARPAARLSVPAWLPADASGDAGTDTSRSTRSCASGTPSSSPRARETDSVSPAPGVLKILQPVVDGLPLVPRLKKMQLSEALTLLFWSGGPRRTAQIVLEGVRFRMRLRTRT